MSRLLAIDPGPLKSAYALVDVPTRQPVAVGIVPNEDMHLVIAQADASRLAIEMVASYGMAVGAEVFDTCVWIGRFDQEWVSYGLGRARLVKRPDVKLHLCHVRNAKDSNVIQALVDRFAYAQPNRGKGTAKAPGWFHGFHDDIWQAYALAVTAADDLRGGEDR